MISVRALSKTFSVHQKEPGFLGSVKSLFTREMIEKVALDNINLEIHPGEILGLIGPNGAGKTTLIKILAGIIHPSFGEVSVLGHRPWDRHNDYRRQMSLIMGQKAQLWWDLPALDSFLLLKEIYQIPDVQYHKSINFLADALMVKDQLKTQVRKLSLGERMKVELMAALLHNPKLVFLDEPTIGLDLMAQNAVRHFIKNYQKEFRPIMILTSHYMDDIEELCERVALIQKGQLIYDGKLESLKQSYASSKLIKAQAIDETEIQKLVHNFPKDLGVLKVFDKQINVHTPRHKTMEAATFLLNSLKIIDLNIHEEDVGEIIEKIMRQGKVHVSS